jgi:O-antigen biosynthesis protein
MQEPRVSVIVCTFNRAGSLRDCLGSVLCQDYPDYEVVVVDDGSTDGTSGMMASYDVSKIPVRYVRQENMGLPAARNAGILNASGEIICFTDDDCTAAPGWIRGLVEAYGSDDVAGAGGMIESHDGGHLVGAYMRKSGLYGKDVGKFLVGANSSFRAGTFKAVGGYDEGLNRLGAEDLDMNIRLWSAGMKTAYAPGAVVCHSHRSTVGGLFAQYYWYGRGYARLHKKYPNSFPIVSRSLMFCKTAAANALGCIIRPFGALGAKDRRLFLAEPFLNLVIDSAMLCGIIIETAAGREYRGKVSYLRVPDIFASD